jgi:hypothetical protein
MFNNGFPENHAVNEIIWKYTAERDGAYMSIRRMRIACWIITATDTHSEYVIIIAFPQQQWVCELPSIVCYTYIACLSITEKDCVYCAVRAESLKHGSGYN